MKSLKNTSDAELAKLKQSAVVARQKAEAKFIAKLEEINAELDRRAALGPLSQFTEDQLAAALEARRG